MLVIGINNHPLCSCTGHHNVAEPPVPFPAPPPAPRPEPTHTQYITTHQNAQSINLEAQSRIHKPLFLFVRKLNTSVLFAG